MFYSGFLNNYEVILLLIFYSKKFFYKIVINCTTNFETNFI